MGRRMLFVAVLVAVTAAGLASCQQAQNFELRTGDVAWHRCGSITCASLSVPLDREHPERGNIALALGRLPATGKREGTVLANPGGPGASGLEFLHFADQVFSPAVRKHYDIVSWDPRGVGASAPIECRVDLDAFFAVDHSPDSTEELSDNETEAEALADGCEAKSARLLPFVSTRSTVKDMDAIRSAIGDDKVTYVGFSYGTYLGALYAQEFPTHIRAMVLDGALDPSLPPEQATEVQAVGFEHSLDAFFDWCRDDSNCGFAGGGDPEAAYERVIAGIDAEPLPAKVDGEKRILGPGEADLGVAQSLYFGRDGWPTLAASLAQAAQGDGSALLSLADEYTTRQRGGKYSNEMFAFYAVSCLDSPAPATFDAVERLADAAETKAPNFGAANFWLGLPCTYWHAKPDGAPAPISAPGAPPIVVIGTTNDPATPLSGAESLAHQLPDGRLLVYEGEGHTAIGRNECIDAAVEKYLLDLEPPADGMRCS